MSAIGKDTKLRDSYLNNKHIYPERDASSALCDVVPSTSASVLARRVDRPPHVPSPTNPAA